MYIINIILSKIKLDTLLALCYSILHKVPNSKDGSTFAKICCYIIIWLQSGICCHASLSFRREMSSKSVSNCITFRFKDEKSLHYVKFNPYCCTKYSQMQKIK